MKENIIGDKSAFAFEYSFDDSSRDTELAIYLEGNNVLAFERNGELLTTRWNLDELAMWLKTFVEGLSDDPYPVECEGEYAAQKDDIARDFDLDDDDIFEAYYQRLYEWNQRHRWHSASSGAVLADLYFQLVGDNVEISWDNRNVEDGVIFRSLTGGVKIPRDQFCSVVNEFLSEYARHWFS